MTDPRTVIAGAIAVLALVGLIVLTALGHGDAALSRLDAIVTGSLGLLFGLHSSPHAEGPGDGGS